MHQRKLRSVHTEAPKGASNMDITNKWLDYLIKERKLSKRVIQQAGLHEKDGWLVIPVEDICGEHLFNKYRRAPWMPETLPKYKYDTGSSVALYNIVDIVFAEHLKTFFCEGEIDALTLKQLGHVAVSSTGGCSSFKEGWKAWLDNHDKYLWYDNDDAGIKGAVKVAFILREFTYVWTPPAFGKDINDLYVSHGKEGIDNAIANGIKISVPELETRSDLISYRYDINEQIRKMSSGSIGTRFLRAMVVKLSEMITEKTKVTRTKDGSNELQRAKNYPIQNIITVRKGFATHCPFHNPTQQKENTPSFKVYPNNTAYCFGQCGKKYDSIDIFMKINNVDFKEALQRMQY